MTRTPFAARPLQTRSSKTSSGCGRLSSKAAGRPGGCHDWLVMGYNLGIAPDHQFYVNLGGSGSGDGWYTLDSMPFNMNQYQGTRVAPTNIKFVGAADAGDGTPNDPYLDIEEARVEAPDHSILVFKAGSTNTFAGTSLTLNRPMTLKGHNARIE